MDFPIHSLWKGLLGVSGHPCVPRSDELPRELYLLVPMLLFLMKSTFFLKQKHGYISSVLPLRLRASLEITHSYCARRERLINHDKPYHFLGVLL